MTQIISVIGKHSLMSEIEISKKTEKNNNPHSLCKLEPTNFCYFREENTYINIIEDNCLSFGVLQQIISNFILFLHNT